MLHYVLVVWYTQFSFCLACEMKFKPNWNIRFWISEPNWMLWTAVCCTALWENSLDIKYYFQSYVLLQIFTHYSECCRLWDAVPSISKLTKETCWLVNISTLSNLLKLYFEKFSLTLYLCHICCVIERIFNWPGLSKNLFNMQYSSREIHLLRFNFKSFKNKLFRKNLHKCVIQVIFWFPTNPLYSFWNSWRSNNEIEFFLFY